MRSAGRCSWLRSRASCSSAATSCNGIGVDKTAIAPARALVRGASGALIVGVIALGTMTARAVRDGNAELRESDLAFNRGDLGAAVLHARRSATAYAPGAPHTRSALE